MALVGERDGDVVRVGADARQRFHDARGYGYPLEGNEIALAPVEAAHLLFHGGLEAIEWDGDTLGFREFTQRESDASFGVHFLVYADLRSRGFYLSPAERPWVGDPPTGDVDFVVYQRGDGRDGNVAYRIRVVGERMAIPASTLSPGVLAVVDEESEITYFAVDRFAPTGSSEWELPTAVAADAFADRVVVWEPPSSLYERGFFGQPLSPREDDDGPLQCSLLEAAYLAERGALSLDESTVRAQGQAVEGDRFDRRARVYSTLREEGIVPKTGYKFGADFRTYSHVKSVDALGHSEHLVRVCGPDHVFEPRALALDVRLAHGVRKKMVFALSGETASGPVEWWTVSRLTP